MNKQKRNDMARANIINYIIDKTNNDVQSGELPQYVNDILEMNIDKINAIYETTKKYGVGALVSGISSIAGIPATIFLTNNMEDFKKGIGLVLIAAGISGLFMLVKSWAKKDQRVAESKLIDLFVDDRGYIKADEMPEEVYNDYINEDIYVEYNQNEMRY